MGTCPAAKTELSCWDGILASSLGDTETNAAEREKERLNKSTCGLTNLLRREKSQIQIGPFGH